MTKSAKAVPASGYNYAGLDYIDEKTTAAGVTIEDVLLKDGTIAGLTKETWTVTAAGKGSMTYTLADSQRWFFRFGKLIVGQVYVKGTTAGSAEGGIRISLPETPAYDNREIFMARVNSPSNRSGWAFIWDKTDSEPMEVRLYDNTGFNIGADQEFWVFFAYEAA